MSVFIYTNDVQKVIRLTQKEELSYISQCMFVTVCVCVCVRAKACATLIQQNLWSKRFRIKSIYHHHHHHHHIALVARISLILSRHSSLSFIALGRSSGQHPVSSHSCWMYVRAGRPAFARPCVGYISYEFISASPAVSCMSGSSNFHLCFSSSVLHVWFV